MARDRPSPYGRGGAFFTVARGPVPRERSMARDRPSPYVKERRFFHRNAEACHRNAKEFETRRSLLPGKQNRSRSHETIITETTLCP